MKLLREEYHSEEDLLIPPPPTEEEMIGMLGQIQDRRKKPATDPDLKEILDTGMTDLFNGILLKHGLGDHRKKIDEYKMEIRPSVYFHKNYHNIDRPQDLAKKLSIPFDYDDLKTAQTPSYPSGHTAQSFYIAYSLSESYPHLRPLFFEMANMVAESRIDRGIHFPSDNDGGKELAIQFFNARSSANMSEARLRQYVKSVILENRSDPDMSQYVDKLENEVFELLFQKSTFDYLQTQGEGIESTMVMDTPLFDEYDNINEVHLGILVNDSGQADVQAAYVCVPEERNKSNLVLSINIPRSYPSVDGFQDWLSAELADALSHEIQHSCDTSEMLSGDIPEGEAKWESLENIEKYYASEAETRGHVAGIRGRSRRTGQDPESLLQYDIETVMTKALDKGYTEEEMVPVVQRIYKKWSKRLGDLK